MKRKRLFEIIEISQDNDRVSLCYDWLMLVAIIVSIVPLAFKETNHFFYVTDIITTTLFIIDYVMRWATADYKLNKSLRKESKMVQTKKQP